MDPASLLLILGLIERTVVLVPQVVALIQRVRAGETITPEEIDATELQIQGAVGRWNAAGGEPEKE